MKTNATMYNQAQIIENGHDFIQANIDLINSSKHFILLHTYIFEDDEVTSPIIEALIEAAKRKVKVFILVDSFGSYNHNYLSRYGNLEMNLVIEDNVFASNAHKQFDKIIANSKQVEESHLDLSLSKRTVQWLTFLLLNIITFLSILSIVLVFKRSEKDNLEAEKIFN